MVTKKKRRIARPELSIVLPVHNEERNIGPLARRYASVAARLRIEVLLVEDGGSTDGTRAEMRRAARRYPFIRPVLIRERGYGISILQGLRKARGEIVGWAHADLQCDPADVLTGYLLLRRQQEPKRYFVKGNRRGRPLLDKAFTTGMSVFESVYLNAPLWDINAQPNLFHHSLLRGLPAAPHDFAFDLFMLYTAHRRGLHILRFPVRFPARRHGVSAWNTGLRSKLRFSLRTVRFSRALKRSLSRRR